MSSSGPALTLFHTSASHVPRFAGLLARLSPDTPVRQVVNEALLREASRPAGVTSELREAVESELRSLAALSRVILCTCSTLGTVAEKLDGLAGARVVRVDRPLAVKAVSTGTRIQVVVALAGTIDASREVIEEEAARLGVDVELNTTLTPGAWERFQAGDSDGYLQLIAGQVDEVAQEADVVVLAQASMMGAEDLVTTRVPVLTSPEAGLRHALELIGVPQE